MSRSSQPDLISGTHLALLENLDPTSKFVTAHAQYHLHRKKKRDAEVRHDNAQQTESKHSLEWSTIRQKSQRVGDYVDPEARYLATDPVPSLRRTLHLEENTTSKDRITLAHICRAVVRLKNSPHMGKVGSYSIRRRDFLQLFCNKDDGDVPVSNTAPTINSNGLEERVRNIWNVWCEAAAEDDSQQARVDAMQLLAGLIWLVPGVVGHERLRAAVELFDPRWTGIQQHIQNSDQPRRRNGAASALSLSQMEVSMMMMTTLSGLCTWTDGFFIPPQAVQINQIATAIFQEQNIDFARSTAASTPSPSASSTKPAFTIAPRMNAAQLNQCAIALEQVSLERILCAEGLSVDLNDHTRSTSTRKSWMESFYYSSYDEKRMKILMNESKDMDEIQGNRSRQIHIERPTAKDILEWKHTIVSQHPSNTPSSLFFSNSLSNLHLQSLTFTKLDQLTDRRIELLTMYLTMNWSHLQVLIMASCNLNTSHIAMLSSGLSINDSIKILDLSNNRAGEQGGIAVGSALRQNASILKLDISQNGLNNKGTQAIGEALSPYALSSLSDTKQKKRRSCMDDGLDYDVIEIETIEDRVGRNDTLECLDLRSNSIGTEGSLIFGDVLRTHPSLTSLNMKDNQIGDQTLMAMSNGILKSQYYIPVLRQMTLNELGDRPTCPLMHLDMSRNNIHDDGIVSLAHTLSSSASFTTMEQEERQRLHVEKMSALQDASLKHAFQSSRPNPILDLMTLNVASNQIRGRGAVALSNAIIASPSLTHLNLSGNKIGFHYAGSIHEKNINYNKNAFNYDTRGAIALAKAIDHNTTLTHLDLSMNSIDTVGGRALLESLQWSDILETFNLSGNEMSKSVVEEQEEIGDPRLDLSHQKRMRMKGGVCLSVPIRIHEEINSTTMGTGGLSVAGNRRSYHAGKESVSQTDYHYALTRWSTNTKKEQLRRARMKYLPADEEDGDGKERKEGGGDGGGEKKGNTKRNERKGTTKRQDQWTKLMIADPDVLHEDGSAALGKK